jgi:hypothetical protein
MQARYRVVSDAVCTFSMRFPSSFRRGERPVGYKGVVGTFPTMFSPFGISRWEDGVFEAAAYVPWARVLLPGVITAVVLYWGTSAAYGALSSGGYIRGVLIFLASFIPLAYGLWHWDQDMALFRAMADEIARDLEDG